MGQEIVYCFKCRKRLIGADYAKGLAFQLENKSCCSSCAVKVLDTLPPKDKELLLGKMFKSTHEHQSGPSRANKGGSGTAPSASTRRIPTSPGPTPLRRKASAPKPGFLGIAAVTLAAIALVVVLFSRSTPQISAPTQSPPPSTVTPIPKASPSESDKKHGAAAREALRKAHAYAQANPKDFEGQAREWRVAVLDAERTEFAEDARRELEKTQVRAKGAATQELADFGRDWRTRADQKEFKAAAELLDGERRRRTAGEWVLALERLDRELKEAVARAFSSIKEKAVAARDRGAQGELDALKAEVARWGLPEYVTALETALELPWRSIFDGGTLKGFPSAIGNAWRVQDGLLIHDNEIDNAAITNEEFGDGEIRFRFHVNGVSMLTLKFRVSGEGYADIEFRNQDVVDLQGAERELILTARGGVLSATLDGKPRPLRMSGQPRAGRVQFNSQGGSFRIKALDFRAAR